MQDLIEKIERAFKDTPRGEIGIREASAIDSRLNPGDLYEDKARYAAARNADNEEDWRQIPDEVLANNPAVFSFLDDAGFIFVMPAVMTWSLKPSYADRWNVVEFFLMKLLPESGEGPDVLAKRYSLSQDQIKVLAAWLDYIAPKIIPYPSTTEADQLTQWKEQTA